jgi:hypothetical protein
LPPAATYTSSIWFWLSSAADHWAPHARVNVLTSSACGRGEGESPHGERLLREGQWPPHFRQVRDIPMFICNPARKG